MILKRTGDEAALSDLRTGQMSGVHLLGSTYHGQKVEIFSFLKSVENIPTALFLITWSRLPSLADLC
jgi:hypothetical protein